MGDPTAPPCLNLASCPYLTRLSSTSTERERHRGSFSIKTAGGSQTTLNTICSSRKSQPNSFVNRLYNSDPNTNMIGEQTQATNEDSDYLSNYAHIKHSHRHPHYHLRRQSQPEELRLMSRNSSSVKSFTSQSFNNPEYFDEIRPARSYDDSRASLISRKLSNQIMLLNSELQLLEQMRDHSYSYPRIDYIDKDFLTDVIPTLDAVIGAGTTTTTSSTPSESSDVSEFHENKTSTLERKAAAQKPIYSETDSYSTVNDEITQLVSKHFSNSIKQLVAQRFTDAECYSFPLRRRHSVGSSESYDDIIIPEFFNSPSRIKWNFLTGLPDHSRSHSQIGSSDYKTDLDDEEECDDHECKIDQILKRKSSSFDTKYHHRDKTVSIWRTNSYGGPHDDGNAIIFHHDSDLVENCCENHFTTNGEDDGKKSADSKETGGEDSTVYEFELCTKENCEYLCQSQVTRPPLGDVDDDEVLVLNKSSPLNNQTFFPSSSSAANTITPTIAPTTTANGNNNASVKNINLKHNKFKMKRKTKKKSTSSAAAKANREHGNVDGEDFLMWSKINLSHLKKDSCNIDSVNLKPNSNSSSSNSLNGAGAAGGEHRRNLKCYKKASSKLRKQPQASLDITTLILASSASTQARLRSDGGIYFSNPDLSHIPADLRTMTNFTNNNNSCQFINNDLRNTNSSNVNVNSRSMDRSQSRGRFDSATNYLTVEESSINSNNVDISNDSQIMQQRRLRYLTFNLNGIARRAQRRARKYFNSLSFASRK